MFISFVKMDLSRDRQYLCARDGQSVVCEEPREAIAPHLVCLLLLFSSLCFINTSALRCSGLCTHQLFLQQQSGHEYSSDKPCRCYLPVKQTQLATSLWTRLDRAGYFPETRTNLKCWATFCTFESQVVPLIPLIVLPNTQQNVMHNI